MALLISNEDTAKVLIIADCIESIEEGVKEYYRSDATCWPRFGRRPYLLLGSRQGPGTRAPHRLAAPGH